MPFSTSSRIWASFAVVVGTLCPPLAEAALHCQEPAIRLGDVRAGVPLSRSFELVNRGIAAVAITEVRPSCGCLAMKLDRRELPPGGYATLRLDINTLTQPAGVQTWRVRVSYRDGGETGDLELSLTARVVTEVIVEPAALVVYASSAISSVVTLRDRRDRPLEIKNATTTSRHVQLTVDPAEQGDDGVRVQRVHLHIQSDCPVGRHDEMLSLFTTDDDYRELRLPFTIVKHGKQRVSAAPASVAVQSAPGLAPPSRIVLLRGPEGQEVDVERIESDHPAVRCTWAKGPGTMTTLKVSFDPARLSGASLNGLVRVLLRGNTETISIPVTVTWR